MDNNFIVEFIKIISDNRNKEFEKFNFKYEDKIIDKKKICENPMEFKKYSLDIKKQSLINKNKPGNIQKKNYEDNNDNVDILEDDIFNNSNNVNNSKIDNVKLDIEKIDIDTKKKLIYNYLDLKNIKLDENNLNKIEIIINDVDVNLKKYISISKIYQNITKISFIKKLEDGSYIVDLNIPKTRKSKNVFFK
jgi:hypothetical protein